MFGWVESDREASGFVPASQRAQGRDVGTLP